jgi:hypothetical protein
MESPESAAQADTFAVRRAQWAAAGLAADERLHRLAVATAVLLGCAFFTVIAVMLYVG